MKKYCTLYENKICDGCGECDICDLDPNKLCNNCGKCLEDYDYSGIQIDDLLIEDAGLEIDLEYNDDKWKFNKNPNIDFEQNRNIVFIDDIEGLTEEIEHDKDHHHHHD